MPKRPLTLEEELERATLNREMERLRGIGAGAPRAPLPPREWEQSTGTQAGNFIADTLKRGWEGLTDEVSSDYKFWREHNVPKLLGQSAIEEASYLTESPYRVPELLARIGHTAGEPAAKIPQYLGTLYDNPKLVEAGQKVEDLIASPERYWGEKAGRYEEAPGPTTMLGSMAGIGAWPGVKSAMSGSNSIVKALKGAGYFGGMSVPLQGTEPWDPKATAAQALMGGAAGGLGPKTPGSARGARKPPRMAKDTVIPEWPAEGPAPSARAPQAPDMPPARPLEPPVDLFSGPEAPVEPGIPGEPATVSTEALVSEMLQKDYTPPPIMEEPIQPSKIYGPSLGDYLRSKDGVAGDRGDIRGMEMPSKPFQKRLLSEEGLQMDEAAKRAYEEGYIDEPTTQKLLEGLDREARGRPPYSPAHENPALLDRQMEQDWLRYRADRDAGLTAEPTFGEAPMEPPVTTAELEHQIMQKLDREPVGGLPMRDRLPDEAMVVPAVQDIHATAQGKGINVEDPAFMDLTERLTGQRHLDDLTGEERQRVLQALEQERPQPLPGELFPGSETMEVGARPIIGREATFEEAPLFSKQAQTPEPEQISMTERPVQREVEAELERPLPPAEASPPITPKQQGAIEKMLKPFDNEMGAMRMLPGAEHLGPIERNAIMVDRVAEKNPDMREFYELMEKRDEFSHQKQYDFQKITAPWAQMPPEVRLTVDTILRDRRRLAATIRAQMGGEEALPGMIDSLVEAQLPMPPEGAAVKQAMDLSRDLLESAYGKRFPDLAMAKGGKYFDWPDEYVPFAREGQYVVLAPEKGSDVPRIVSAFGTRTEAEQMIAQLERERPGQMFELKMAEQPSPDLAGLDMVTLGILQKKGMIDPNIVNQLLADLNVPLGIKERFLRAQNVVGEQTDLLRPAYRYFNQVSKRVSDLEHNERIQEAISKIKNEDHRGYAQQVFDYSNKHHEEFQSLRGFAATWALAGNVASAVMNATGMLVTGLPRFMKDTGTGAAQSSAYLSKAMLEAIKPDVEAQHILSWAERDGAIDPRGTYEMFGTTGQEKQLTHPSSAEFGGKDFQRWLMRQEAGGGTAGQAARGVYKGTEPVAGLYRGLSNKVREQTPNLMTMFAGVERGLRRTSILAAYRAFQDKGLPMAEAYEKAKEFSRHVNFNYSAWNRPPLLRGRASAVGVFTTYPIGWASNISQFATDALQSARGTAGVSAKPLLAAAGIYLGLAGLRGVPGLQTADERGWLGEPGLLSQNLPRSMWRGIPSALTGYDFSGKASLNPVPISTDPSAHNLLGKIDVGKLPVLSPFSEWAKAGDLLSDDPSLRTLGKVAPRLFPSAIRNLGEATKWGAEGEVSDILDRPIGLDEKGDPMFYRPTGTDIFLKGAFGLNPVEYSEAIDRKRIASVKLQQDEDRVQNLVKRAAGDIDRNGWDMASNSSPSLKELQARAQASKQPNNSTYAHLRKAHGQRGNRPTFQSYQLMQAENKAKKVKALDKREAVGIGK